MAHETAEKCLDGLSLPVPLFFTKIPDDRFDAGTDFIVKESKKMHLVIGILLLVFSGIFFQGSVLFGAAAAVAGVFSLLKSRKDQTIMKVNSTGFFYYGDLITNWRNFVSVDFVDEPPAISSSSTGLSDKFFLALKYYKDGRPECFARKFSLTNTQDKSEEEIIAAIRFYYKNFKKSIE